MADELTPSTNIEKFLAKTAGESVELPEPVTRIEQYLNKIASDQTIVEATEGWLSEHIDPQTGYAVDNTLSVTGAAADAKATGDALTAQSEKIDDITAYNTITLKSFPSSAGTLINNVYVWICKNIPIQANTYPTIKIKTAASNNKNYKLFLLRKNSDTNYTIVKEVSGTSSSSAKTDTHDMGYIKETLYLGLYSADGAFYARTITDDYGAVVRAEYSSFVSGSGTSDVTTVAANFDFNCSIEYKRLGVKSKFRFNNGVVVDASGNGDFTSIQEAINNTSANATILIMPGTYYEKVDMETKNRHLMGFDRETTIIASTSKLYGNEPLKANVGSISNLTLIAGYGLTPIEGDTDRNSYALHIDRKMIVDHTFVVDNCKIISNVAAAIGIGVNAYQKITIKNCYIETKAETMYSEYTSSLFNVGGIFAHNDAQISNTPGARLEVTDCEIKGVITALTLQSQNNGSTLDVRFANNLLWSTENGETNAVTIRTTPTEGHIAGSDVVLDSMSYGNNIGMLNAIDDLHNFVVTLTPTAQDFSGTMDKTVAEITTAYQAGKQIVFKMYTSETTFIEVPVSLVGYDSSYTYPSFETSVIQITNNLLIYAQTRVTSVGTDNLYYTTIYPLTPMT